MSKTKYRSSHRSVFNLTVHMVFVTKYRRKVIDAQMLAELKIVFESVLEAWNCQLIEFSGEADHCHLIVSFPPQKRLSDLVGNLKATSSKAMWKKFELTLSKIYYKKVFWTASYFIASCGGVTIEKLKQYVQSQDSPTQ
jgi:putative transposase